LRATAVVGLLYVPFLDHGAIPIGSLGTSVQRFRFNDPVFAALERLAPPKLVAGLALLAGLPTAAWLRRAVALSSCRLPVCLRGPMAACLVCAPVVCPMVPPLAAGVPDLRLDTADYRLNSVHHRDVRGLALAHAGPWNVPAG
jgi:hypothetical protein